MHVRGQGSESPKSPLETRQVLDKQSKVVEICRSKVSEQTCSRTGERTHECISEFVSLAQTYLGVDAVKRLEAYPAEDVEKDQTGTAIPNDVFHEEPQLEETKVPEQVPNEIRLAIMRVHKNLEKCQQGIAVSRFANWWSKQNCAQSCESTQARCVVRRTNLRKVTCLRSQLVRTLNSIKVLEWISLCWLRRTSVCVPELCRLRHEIQNLLSSSVQKARRRFVGT